MKVINGTGLVGVSNSIVYVKHGDPVPEVLVAGSEERSGIPIVSWYWGTELITLLWRGITGRTYSLRIPPEQTVMLMQGELAPAGDIDVGTGIAGAGGDVIEILGYRHDKAQTSMANIVFNSHGTVVADGGVILPV